MKKINRDRLQMGGKNSRPGTFPHRPGMPKKSIRKCWLLYRPKWKVFSPTWVKRDEGHRYGIMLGKGFPAFYQNQCTCSFYIVYRHEFTRVRASVYTILCLVMILKIHLSVARAFILFYSMYLIYTVWILLSVTWLTIERSLASLYGTFM